MKKWTLLVIGSASGVVLAAALARSADLQSMAVTSVTGSLDIHQELPCHGSADKKTTVIEGRLEITPAEGIDVAGGKRFTLTRMNLSFATPFSVSGSCLGFGATRTYTTLSVQLGQAADFTATAAGGGVYNVTIPKDHFLIYEGAIVDGTFERGYKHPREDVTGTIDFTLGIVTMHAVFATTVHFEAGCLFGLCAIKEDDDGTLTADLSGTIVLPDSDGDGVPDAHDNCRFVPNPNQVRILTPVINPPPRVNLASCADGHIGTPFAADVCDGGEVTVTNNAPNTFALGQNVVTWQVQDTQNRVATTTQNVTVIDTTPPIYMFIPPDFTVNDCGPVSAIALGLPTASDDCDGPVTFTNNAPNSFGVGTTPVTWIARDVSGNHTLATQMITVHDTVPPAVACTPAEDPNDDDRGRGRDGDRDRDRDSDHDDVDDGFFRVSSSDACSAAPIQLGNFTLAQGEIVKITRTRRPGVVHVGDVGRRHVRHFRVGPGENVIIAFDGSGNVGRASCVVPHEHGRN